MFLATRSTACAPVRLSCRLFPAPQLFARAGANPQIGSVKRQAQTAEEEQRRKVHGHNWVDWVGKCHCAISARKIVNYNGQEHAEQSATYLSTIRAGSRFLAKCDFGDRG
jgi:hypothetical protein